jgi:uncharacterized membrane-anchored protein
MFILSLLLTEKFVFCKEGALYYKKHRALNYDLTIIINSVLGSAGIVYISMFQDYIYIYIYRVSQEERSVFWEVIVSVILSKKLYMNMCPIPNGFRDRTI